MDSVFFIASKLIWAAIRPETLLLLLIALSLFSLRRNSRRSGVVALTIAFGASLAITIFPLGNLVLQPLETRYLVNPILAKVDGIVILGGAEHSTRSSYWKQSQLSSSAERLINGVALARRYPLAKLVYTGGSGSLLNQSETGAMVAEKVLLNLGIDRERLVIENKSRNTFENAAFSRDLVNPKKEEVWVLITSASHMPRAVGVFCQIGWPVIPYPVDFRSGAFVQEIGWDFANNLDDLNIGVKEWLGALSYWLTGKLPSLLTDTC